MRENKKRVNIPLFATILGLVALAVLIVFLFLHNLSSNRAPKIKESSSKTLVSKKNEVGNWAGNYQAGNTTWSTNIAIKKDGTFVQHDTAGEDNILVNQGLELAETSGKITKGKV